MIYIGIDPGASGGIAFLGESKGSVRAVRIPESDRDLWDLVAEGVGMVHPFGSENPTCFAVLEKVGGHLSRGGPVCPVCHQARNRSPGSAMFNFGAGVGRLRMALTAAGVPYEEVTPQKWLKEFGMVRHKGEADTAWKNRLKDVASKLYPREKVTHAVADALLIATYCMRTHGKAGCG